MIKTYQVMGMSCAACATRVQKAAMKATGVENADVNLMQNILTVTCSDNLKDEDVIKAVTESGYGAKVMDSTIASIKTMGKDSQGKDPDFINLILAIVATLIIMLISMGHMTGFEIIHNGFINAAVQGVLTFFVMVLEKKYFINAFKGLKHLSTNMDTLVSLGAIASFIYSVFVLSTIEFTDTCAVLMDDKAVYFEGAAGILCFVSIGKYIEKKAKVKTTDAINALYNLIPESAVIKAEDGTQKTVALQEVKKGQILLVKQGQRLGVDGVVVSGEGFIDESSLTGESREIKKVAGDVVKASIVLTDGYLEVEVTTTGEDTTLGKIIKLVEKTAATKVPVARIADVVASYFVPFILTLALITFVAWYFIHDSSLSLSLQFAISVLVVSCPCALGLATPVAVVAGTGRAAKEGIIFKNPEALEELSRVRVFAFDKTGTLTYGKMSVSALEKIDKTLDDDFIKSVVLSLEKKSSHPIARSVATSFKNAKLVDIPDYTYIKGEGVKGTVNNSVYAFGNDRMLKSMGVEDDAFGVQLKKTIARSGALVLTLLKDKSIIAYITVKDTLKEDAKDLVVALRSHGKETLMLTGDSDGPARDVAKSIKLDSYASELTPEQKATFIKNMQSTGRKVAMAGDGVNDSISLSQADVGIGLKGTADIAVSACDVILLHEKVTDVFNAYLISFKTMLNIKENLFWALIYNVLTIPVAAGLFYESLGVKLNPMLCSALMGISSVCVVLNALRLSFMKVLKTENAKFEVLEKEGIAVATVKIDGMQCQHCVKSVQKALTPLSDNGDVQVSLEQKKATLALKTDVTDDMIKDAIADAGFKVVEIIHD
ncbi:MAG: heavy metal translocating P-type ATPase [Succinivibrio sp.]|jgi:heavy metal translocating P-type ATPase|nr:heavy metal translocating P-type ATPase [Succinivibrio sp.]